MSTNNSNNIEKFKIIIFKKRLIQKQHIPSRSSVAETRLYERSKHPWRITFIVNHPRVQTRVSQRVIANFTYFVLDFKEIINKKWNHTM